MRLILCKERGGGLHNERMQEANMYLHLCTHTMRDTDAPTTLADVRCWIWLCRVRISSSPISWIFTLRFCAVWTYISFRSTSPSSPLCPVYRAITASNRLLNHKYRKIQFWVSANPSNL
jgi:hypothetical protein